MAEGVDDIRSFWKWVEGDLQQVLHHTLLALNLDLNNLLVGGESAGGYHAAQTALLGLTNLQIKVLFLQYPALDLSTQFRIPDTLGQEGAHHHTVFSEVVPYSVVEEHLARLKGDKICTRAKFGTRMPLLKAMVQAKRFVDLSGNRSWIDPMNSLEIAGKLPPILLYQSKEDEAVSDMVFKLLQETACELMACRSLGCRRTPGHRNSRS